MELSSGLLSSFACWISSRRHAAEQRRAYTTARPCANMLLCRRRFALFLFWPGTHTYSGRYPLFWFSCTRYPGALRAYAQLTATQGSDRKEEEGQEMKFTIQFTGF